MLAALSFGLPAYVVVKVLQPSFFAREDTKTPMLYSGLALVANAILSPLLFVLVGPPGIAMATSLVGWINVVLLAFALRGRGEFVLDDAFRRAFRGIVLASAAMGLGLWWLAGVLWPYFDPAYGKLSPGTYSILEQIELCRRWELDYLLSLIHISEPTRHICLSRMPSSA